MLKIRFLNHNNSMKIKKYLWVLPLLIILIYSVMSIYNARYLDSIYKSYFVKQIIWCILGFIILLLCQKINVEKLFKISFFIYIICNILLLLVLFFGVTVNGAKAWFNFKFFAFQPSEIMRVSLMLFLTNYTYKFNKNSISQIKYIFMMILYTLIPSVLVFLEPDTGSIIFYIIILICCFFNSKISKKWYIVFGIIACLFIGCFTYLYLFNQDLLISLMGTSFFYRTDRIINFYKDTGYQIENALTTISSAGLFGKGLGKILLYIPEGATDFAFSFSIGNFGIISGIIILICYYILDMYLIIFKKQTKNSKYKIFISCFIAMFFFQQFYNILMNVNMMPIMGIPLPFLSYGGTTLLVYFIFLGLIINMQNQR